LEGSSSSGFFGGVEFGDDGLGFGGGGAVELDGRGRGGGDGEVD